MKMIGATPAAMLLIAALAVAGCQSGQSSQSSQVSASKADIAQVQGRTWIAETIEGQAVTKGVESTLELAADGSAFGSAGCNRLIGSFTANGEHLRFGHVGTTMMACPDAQMAQERRFTAALERVDRWALDGGALLLYAADGSIPPSRFKAQP